MKVLTELYCTCPEINSETVQIIDRNEPKGYRRVCNVTGYNINYATAPNQKMVPAIKRYVENRIEPGGFLTALLSNDLSRTFARADETNGSLIREWVVWVWNDMPPNMVGHEQKVRAWLDDRPEPWSDIGKPQHSCSQPNCPGRVPVE